MIYRELVTRLGFSFDRTNLDKFERSIIGFKTQAAIAATSIGYALKKVFGFASDLADAGIATKDLANYAGIAVDEFVALKSAAEKLTLKPEQFNNAIHTLSVDLKEAAYGFGRLFDVVKESNGKINFKDTYGQLVSVKDVLFQIFDFVSAIEDKQRQLFVLGNIFGVDSAGAWLRVIEKGRDAFIELADKEAEFGKTFEASLPALEKYQQEVSVLGKEFNELVTTIGKIVVPQLIKVVGGVNVIANQAKDQGFFGSLDFIGSAVADGFYSVFGENTLERAQREVKENDIEFQRRFVQYEEQKASNNSANITNNNSFEFNVPAGTTEQQANFMSDAIKQSVNAMWDEKTREVISNNPQVE